ncbi:deoxyribodipyrimidine photolyase-related protein [Lishizhenia tianjinensis]|uniref:Deoxyribodipyrimidine photolyase-related protein n=1 Tax=Lishizhenia tianjinensis TaxID=477690 RepID=A0A1I6XUK3_9FLAO|nr:cryptochrome/photolyase family protein [Lishizhenia tianjinensis]SFT41777.1 deoxyribodipyrimidine photolyase-related protein [Lishizhenia tianjinensis]
MKTSIALVFPHQLFKESKLLDLGVDVYIIEEFLFFKLYKFHKQKIAFHRASMQAYKSYLEAKGLNVHYISSQDKGSDIRELDILLNLGEIDTIHLLHLVDNWLEKRLFAFKGKVKFEVYDTPSFVLSRADIGKEFKSSRKSFFQTTFYKKQRQRFQLLLDEKGEPEGGQWSFDADNRKKYPKGKTPPPTSFPSADKAWEEAIIYVDNYFSENPGELQPNSHYPLNFQEAEAWFQQFLDYRFHEFGVYEDAIVREESVLNHSLLSPLLNVGLLLPMDVINTSIDFAKKNQVPINSLEGFVRQIISWREFIRGLYVSHGVSSRTQNFWKFTRPIPPSFYTGETGIPPIDETIKKVLKTGYCHHIERLMVLGNFMLLCQFDPDEVYRWFMELFIDAYDWVMVPNVYGMSQFADGGLFATKPYLSSSNYILKMSNYSKGDWQQTWDGLFWNFIAQHEDFFAKNHRTGFILANYRKQSNEQKAAHLEAAQTFLNKLN